MDPSPQQQQNMLDRIAGMEAANVQRRQPKAPGPHRQHAKAGKQDLEADAALPPLPAVLPRPEYALQASTLGHDKAHLNFYLACESGRMERLREFVEASRPGQPVLDYGLEQAAFGLHADAVRYLLGKGANLHSNAFQRAVYPNPSPFHYDSASIFDDFTRPEHIIALLQVYMDVGGWQPNQPWLGLLADDPTFPLNLKTCFRNRLVVKFLLSNGADPKLEARLGDVGLNSVSLINRHGCTALVHAIRTWDTALLQDILPRGAPLSAAYPFHCLREPFFKMQGMPQGLPFSQRQPMAELILRLVAEDIDAIKSETTFSLFDGMQHCEQSTALSHACVFEDWEYVEWLLENGADPNLLDSKALKPQQLQPGFPPKDNSNMIKALVDKMNLLQ